jgi:hypothetical protein
MYLHGFSSRERFGSTLDIDVDEESILDSIATDKLVRIVSERRKELMKDPKSFENEERWRKDWVETISIDLDEYDLMYIQDEALDDFSIDQIIEYLEKKGYQVTDDDEFPKQKSLSKVCSDYFFNHTKFKNKEFLLNMLDLSSYATEQDIVDRIKEIIN